MSLPLLPSEAITQVFNQFLLVENFRTPGMSAEEVAMMVRAHAYMESQWIRQAEAISVHDSVRRTNNCMESLHAKMLSKMGYHPSFWSFIGELY